IAGCETPPGCRVPGLRNPALRWITRWTMQSASFPSVAPDHRKEFDARGRGVLLPPGAFRGLLRGKRLDHLLMQDGVMFRHLQERVCERSQFGAAAVAAQMARHADSSGGIARRAQTQ